MKLLRPPLLLAICLISLMGLAATASAQTPLVASFDVFPAEPVAGQVVQFVDTTKNPTAAHYEYAWDLDADDLFDDDTAATTTRAFPAGKHRVALRVRRIGTVTVTRHRGQDDHGQGRRGADADPDRRPQRRLPTVAAAPEPPAGRPHRPPVRSARPDHAVPRPARAGSTRPRPSTPPPPATPTARSSATSGTSTATAASRSTAAPFRTRRPPTATSRRPRSSLRVTDDKGATNVTSMELHKLAPACVSYVKVDRVFADVPVPAPLRDRQGQADADAQRHAQAVDEPTG